MIEAQAMQHRRLQIMDVNFVFHVEPNSSVLPTTSPPLHAAAGQPHGEHFADDSRPGSSSGRLILAHGVRPNSPPQITSVFCQQSALL